MSAVFQSRDRIATLGPPNRIRIRTPEGEEKAAWALPEAAQSLTRAGDGTHLFTLSEDGSVARLFDESGGQVVALRDHADAITSIEKNVSATTRFSTWTRQNCLCDLSLAPVT